LSAPDYFKVPLLSILTAMFVHASWLHLIPNMIFLLVFGEKVENILGRVKYLGLYFASGILATLASVLLAGQYDTVPLVGASGAIAGILGAYLVMCPLKRVVGLCVPLFFIPLILPAWIVLGTWILAQWLYAAGAGLTAGATSGYVAHVFGFTYVGALYAAATGRSSWEEKQKPVEPIALEDDVIWPPAPGNLKWPMWLAIAGIFLGPVPGLIALIWSLNIWWDCKRYHAQTRKALNIIVLSAFSVLAGSVQGVVVVTLLRNLF
jgi:membrane associated rhomboid family serine protease